MLPVDTDLWVWPNESLTDVATLIDILLSEESTLLTAAALPPPCAVNIPGQTDTDIYTDNGFYKRLTTKQNAPKTREQSDMNVYLKKAYNNMHNIYLS